MEMSRPDFRESVSRAYSFCQVCGGRAGRTALYLGHMFIRGEGLDSWRRQKPFTAAASKEISSSVFPSISMDVAYCVYGSTPSTSHCVCSDLLLNEFIFFDPAFLLPLTNETYSDAADLHAGN